MSYLYIQVAFDGTPLDWFDRPWPLGEANTYETSRKNGKPYIVPAKRVGFEPFDWQMQVRTGPTLVARRTDGDLVYRVRDKTTEELAAEKAAAHEGTLGRNAMKLGRVHVALVKVLAAKGLISMSDFPPGIRADFLELKSAADAIED